MAVNGMKINDINAIINLKHTWQFILDNIDYPIDFRYISQLNKIDGDYNLIPYSGEIRKSDVPMGGTSWKPDLPDKEDIENKINEINSIKNISDRAITMMLYLMRTQPFYDGNKRTAMMAANQIMIQNGKGIISVPIEHQITLVICQIVLMKKFRLWLSIIKRIFENKNLKILFFLIVTKIYYCIKKLSINWNNSFLN